MKINLTILVLLASFSAFCDVTPDWDAMGNPIMKPEQPRPQPHP